MQSAARPLKDQVRCGVSLIYAFFSLTEFEDVIICAYFTDMCRIHSPMDKCLIT